MITSQAFKDKADADIAKANRTGRNESITTPQKVVIDVI